MEIAKYNGLQNDLRNVYLILESDAKGIVGVLRLNLVATAVAFKIYLSSKRITRKIRDSMALCEEACDTGNCLKTFYRHTKDVMDLCIKSVSMLEASPYLWKWPILRLYRRTLESWGEIAEDCLIGSDIEIKNLINRIADAA